MSEDITTGALKPTLEGVRHRFESWRKHRRVRGPIPEALWQATVELCEDHSIFHVCRALRLNYTDLKDRVQKARDTNLAARDRWADVGFMELELGTSITPSECIVEMEAPNGAKMKMYFKGAQKDLDPVELSRAFWRQGS